MSVSERCPSYKESNKGNKQRQGPTLGVRFTEVSVKRESTVLLKCKNSEKQPLERAVLVSPRYCRAMVLDLSRRVEALLQINSLLTSNCSNMGRKNMLFQWTKKTHDKR